MTRTAAIAAAAAGIGRAARQHPLDAGWILFEPEKAQDRAKPGADGIGTHRGRFRPFPPDAGGGPRTARLAPGSNP